MKKVISAAVASLLLTTAVQAKDFYASVNGEKITKTDIALILQDPRIQFDQLPQTAQKKVLEQIINKKLVAQKALKDGIEKDKEFEDALNKMKQDLAFQIWQKKQAVSIKISDKEAKTYYEKNKTNFKQGATLEARHILVKTEDEAKTLIKDLDKAKDKEAKFIELAKTKSTGPSGSKGGYLGKFQSAQMVPEFSKATESLKEKSYSKKPVKTQFGYHVIYLIGKNAPKTLSFKEVKGNISQILLQEKYGKKIKKIIEDLRKKAKIVIK